MNKDSYTLKDILFGLRYEYLKLWEQLNELNKYILMDENNIDNVYFHLIHSYPEDEVRMLCTIYDRKNKIEKMLEKIKIQLGIYPNYKVSYVDNKDGFYNILDYPFIVDNSKIDEFTQDIYDIFNSEFGSNIKFIHSGIGYDNLPFLSVHPGYISFYLNGYASLEYNPHKGDYVHMYGYKNGITNDKIDTILNIDFPKKIFPEYYQCLIESYSSTNKECAIIGDIKHHKKIDLEIIDEPKKMILRKK